MNVDYYLIELAKNALEYVGGGEIKVTFEDHKITIIVNDQGPGFDDPNDNIYSKPGHGLSSVVQYADNIIIETKGNKFGKIENRDRLIKIGRTNIRQGSKITFTKSIQ